jgi:CRP-like cAMP-binding protein
MTDQIRLRQYAIASNVAFITYGAGSGLWPPLLLHVALLPLNVLRLRSFLHERALIARAASAAQISPAWLAPFMQSRRYPAGTVLFRRGDPADRIYFLAEGRLRLDEIGLVLEPGTLLGEIGIFSPAGARTQTAIAIDDVVALSLTRHGVLALYRRDPEFGIYLIRLITQRLIDDVAFEHAHALAT